MATTRISPNMIILLVVFFLLTVLFFFLMMKETGRVDELMSTSDRKNSVPGMMEELKKLRTDISTKQSTEALLQREANRLDLALGHKRVYMAGDKVVVGVATANAVGTFPESATVLTKGLVQESSKRLTARSESIAGDGWQQSPDLSALIAKRQEQLADLNKRINDLEGSWREDEDKLKAQKKKVEVALEKGRKKQDDDTSTRLTRIGQTEVKIRELLELELRWVKDLEPVGQVLDATSKRVIINLGAQEHIQPGMLFEVFQHDRGRYIEKGMVEVVEVRPQIAICRVLSVKNSKTWPLAINDFIGNPVFSPDRPKVVVVAGDFTRFNRSDIENFLRQTGAVVRDRLSPGVDFLVAGKNCELDLDHAREFQVQAMDEARVLKYLRTEFRPGVTAAK